MNTHNNRGIALIQVLIISIILTMLGIYINQTVRSQINTVALMKNSFELNLQLENAEAELLHELLTNPRYRKAESENTTVSAWNFYGEAFLLNENTTVYLQDISSLISVNITDDTLARNVFEQLGYSGSGHEVRTFLDSLADWKDKDDLKRLNGAESDFYHSLKKVGPRNAYLQTLDEVFYIKQSDILTDDQWRRYFTHNIVGNFNPFNAPKLILKGFVNDEHTFENIIMQRDDGTLTPLSFYQATGIDQDEYIRFGTGGLLKVTLVTAQQKIKLSKQFIVDLRPSSRTRPVTISQLTWNQK